MPGTAAVRRDQHRSKRTDRPAHAIGDEVEGVNRNGLAGVLPFPTLAGICTVPDHAAGTSRDPDLRTARRHGVEVGGITHRLRQGFRRRLPDDSTDFRASDESPVPDHPAGFVLIEGNVMNAAQAEIIDGRFHHPPAAHECQSSMQPGNDTDTGFQKAGGP